MRIIPIIAGLLVMLLAGCATPGPTITTNANPETVFSSFGTYNFMQPLGTDRPGGVGTPLSTMLSNSMSKEMASRGFQRSDTPDLLINFFVNTEDRMSVRTVPTTSSFHSYRMGRYSTWRGYETRVTNYTQGTLSIDLVDVANNMLAWEGVAENRLRTDVRNVTQEQSDDIVRQVMAQFMPVKSSSEATN
jgi:hypothetical protein